MNDLNVIAITCNCGNAKYYLERKVQLLLEEYHKRNEPNSPQPSFYRLYWEHRRIYELRQSPSLQELAKDCGVLDFLQRPLAGFVSRMVSISWVISIYFLISCLLYTSPSPRDS